MSGHRLPSREVVVVGRVVPDEVDAMWVVRKAKDSRLWESVRDVRSERWCRNVADCEGASMSSCWFRTIANHECQGLLI